MQHLAIYGNLVLGHPLQPPVGFVSLTQPLPGGGWPFLLFRHPHSRIYTIILDATEGVRSVEGRSAQCIGPTDTSEDCRADPRRSDAGWGDCRTTRPGAAADLETLAGTERSSPGGSTFRCQP